VVFVLPSKTYLNEFKASMKSMWRLFVHWLYFKKKDWMRQGCGLPVSGWGWRMNILPLFTPTPSPSLNHLRSFHKKQKLSHQVVIICVCVLFIIQ
jgi:hypothetical protein